MSSESQQIEASIQVLEGQRRLLGDAVVDRAVAPLRARLAALRSVSATTAEPAQALRLVSILFLDIVGSTALSQELDPEEIGAVMDGALARGSAVVAAHGGRVLQYAGDNILAAFGADVSHEDDAERAVRCGLALLELGRALGAEVLSRHGQRGFDVRVGIHTGSVLLGGGVDADGAIRGMPVNIAARMEQTAPSGALRISHGTHAQVRGLFEVQAQEPFAVKGVDMPVHSYLVVRAKPRSFRTATRGIEGVATRMIGRDAELEQLQLSFRQLLAERRCMAVTVVAEAGLGKSRLLHEFESWAEARPGPESFSIFRGRATPHTQGQPFGLLRDILAWRFQIADDDSVPTARGKLERGIIPLFLHDDGPDLAEGHAHLLGHLIGIEYRESRHIKGILSDPKQIRDRALHAAAQLFRRVNAGGGSALVLLIEDLHWADNESLDFLSGLVGSNRDLPMLALFSGRPTLFERRSDWTIGEGMHRRIDLAPLDKGMSRILADELLKKLPDIPPALRELVTGGAEGNPFYMEELVKMLIDQDAIRTGERWTLNADRLLTTHVPATLTGVLQARLDGLPAAERLALQEASVIGHVFWDQALFALDAQARDTLPKLVQRELTLPRADAESTMREYAFKHHILHQVTYRTVLKRSRRELHAKLAHWLSAQTGLRASDFLGATAEHYEQAGDEANAVEFHVRAAEHAYGRFAHDATLSHVQRALDLLGPGADAAALRWRLLKVRELTLDLQGRRAEQGVDIEALERLAEALDDDHRRAHAAWRRGARALRTADWPEQEAAGRRAHALAERAGADELRLLSLRQVAHATAMQGDRKGSKAMAQQGLGEARALGLRRMEAFWLNTLNIVASIDGDSVTGLELNRQCLEICRQIGDRRNEAVALGNMGNLWLDLGDNEHARHDLEEALRLHRVTGNRYFEGMMQGLLSQLALRLGDNAGARRLAQAALDTAVAVGARDTQADALCFLGHAELTSGHHAEAAEAYGRVRAVALEIGSYHQHRATVGLVRVALAQGDMATALQEAERLMVVHAAAGSEQNFWDREIELTCYRVLAAAGDARASQWLHLAHSKLQAQAAAVADATLRHGFLANIPDHREIVGAWAAHNAG